MTVVTTADLLYDPNEVGSDLVVLCWISQGPRADDAGFDPLPGDPVRVTDADGEDLTARVVRRDDNRVWVRLDVPGLLSQLA